MNSVLGIFFSYRNSNLFLPGVLIDEIRLKEVIYKKKLTARIYNDHSDPKPDIVELSSALTNYPAELIWICGHGYIENNDNKFLLSAYSSLSWRSVDVQEMMQKRMHKQNLVCCVFDFCHASTLLNLKYYFSEKGDFLAKVADNKTQLYSDNPNKLIITIAAASDFEQTGDDPIIGGTLSNLITRILIEHGQLNLAILNSYRSNQKFVISLNRTITKDFLFLKINEN